MTKEIKTSLNGEVIEVHGFFTEEQKGDYHTPGLPADFEIYKIIYMGIDVMPLINDADLYRISEDCVAACQDR